MSKALRDDIHLAHQKAIQALDEVVSVMDTFKEHLVGRFIHSAEGWQESEQGERLMERIMEIEIVCENACCALNHIKQLDLAWFADPS